jgi:hypothetical protein
MAWLPVKSSWTDERRRMPPFRRTKVQFAVSQPLPPVVAALRIPRSVGAPRRRRAHQRCRVVTSRCFH